MSARHVGPQKVSRAASASAKCDHAPVERRQARPRVHPDDRQLRVTASKRRYGLFISYSCFLPPIIHPRTIPCTCELRRQALREEVRSHSFR